MNPHRASQRLVADGRFVDVVELGTAVGSCVAGCVVLLRPALARDLCLEHRRPLDPPISEYDLGDRDDLAAWFRAFAAPSRLRGSRVATLRLTRLAQYGSFDAFLASHSDVVERDRAAGLTPRVSQGRAFFRKCSSSLGLDASA